jgi:hypothetical protein
MQAESRDEILNSLLTTPRELNQLRTTNKRCFRRAIPLNFSWKFPRVSQTRFLSIAVRRTTVILNEFVELGAGASFYLSRYI